VLLLCPQVERIIVTHGKPEHPHNSDEFFAHTGLQEYPKYMVGGGYVISDDVARWVTQWSSLLAACASWAFPQPLYVQLVGMASVVLLFHHSVPCLQACAGCSKRNAHPHFDT
jgi:hypothetical protein